MSSWCYGLVKEKDGKIRLWEIMSDEGKKPIIWGTPAHFTWWIRELNFVFKDLYGQYKYKKKLFTEEELQKGTVKIAKKWSKEINTQRFIKVKNLK